MSWIAFIRRCSGEDHSRLPNASTRGAARPSTAEAAVLDRLAEVRGVDALAAGEVGERARDAQHAVVGARRQAESFDRTIEQRVQVRVERAVALDFAIAEPRVRLARPLQLAHARGGDARAHARTGF